MARQKKSSNDETIRHAIEQHLRYRARLASHASDERHLDEDSLAAFVEGCLSEPESAPVISHLVACGFCRQATAQLIRLESEMGETETALAPQQPEPGRIRRLLESLAARVLPQSDEEAVFAYHAPADDLQHEAEKSSAATEPEQNRDGSQPSAASDSTTRETDA
ncbi:MAG TPA: hypothetical protein VGB73_07545 [Pyrinomonadaceae bacterium]|jgi:hypothetical protein